MTQPVFSGGVDAPHPPAAGGNGRWVKLGEVGVDSASIGITDLLMGVNDSACRPNDPHARYATKSCQWAGDWGTGVRFWAGFGDGGYDVWGWVIDCGEGDRVDERIALVTVTLIDQTALTDWHER